MPPRVRSTNAGPRQMVLLRHGASLWNKENLFSGWTDVDLSDRGRDEGREAGRDLKAVIAALRDAGGCVNHSLVRVSVRCGTVLLEGYQNDIPGRLAAAEAAASVPGVEEIIDMLMIHVV